MNSMRISWVIAAASALALALLTLAVPLAVAVSRRGAERRWSRPRGGVSRRREAGEPELHVEGREQSGRPPLGLQGEGHPPRLLGDVVRPLQGRDSVVRRVPGEVRTRRSAGRRRLGRRHAREAHAVRGAVQDELRRCCRASATTMCRRSTVRCGESRSPCSSHATVKSARSIRAWERKRHSRTRSNRCCSLVI